MQVCRASSVSGDRFGMCRAKLKFKWPSVCVDGFISQQCPVLSICSCFFFKF